MPDHLDIHRWTPGQEGRFLKRLLPRARALGSDIPACREALEALRTRSSGSVVGVKVRGVPTRRDWQRELAKLADNDVAVVVAAPRSYLELDLGDLLSNGRPRIPDEIDVRKIVVDDDDIEPVSLVLGNEDFEPLQDLLERGPRSIAPSSGSSLGRPLDRQRLASLAASVCLIEVDSRPCGTGVLIEPGLVLTALHVLPTPSIARRARVVFDYTRRDAALRRFPVREVYRPARDLDAVVVGFAGSTRGRHCVPLRTQREPRAEDEAVILQHPAGMRMSIVYRSSEITDVRSPRFQYRADTRKGSSGAPVFLRGRLALAGIHVQGGELPRLRGERGLVRTNEGLLAAAIRAAL